MAKIQNAVWRKPALSFAQKTPPQQFSMVVAASYCGVTFPQQGLGILTNFTFQQNNDPKAKATQVLLNIKKVSGQIKTRSLSD